jgi:hypothetical protein|tara:strand:+ start:1520 stop:1783 length:264 start_codon:yes stop_codon:yes gene_type:complete
LQRALTQFFRFSFSVGFGAHLASGCACRGGILANMVQVFLLGRDCGNLSVIWACQAWHRISTAVLLQSFWGCDYYGILGWARKIRVK